MSGDYILGFADACARLGVDPERLVKAAQWYNPLSWGFNPTAGRPTTKPYNYPGKYIRGLSSNYMLGEPLPAGAARDEREAAEWHRNRRARQAAAKTGGNIGFPVGARLAQRKSVVSNTN